MMHQKAALVVVTALAASATWAQPTASAAPSANDVAGELKAIQILLSEWQIDEAAQRAQALDQRLPDVPFVQSVLGEVKFHQGDYAGARALLRRASEGGAADPTLLMLADQTFSETEGYVSRESEHFVMRVPPGKDEVLFEPGLWALEQAYARISDAFDYHPQHKIPVDVLHDAEGLSQVSTLTAEEIQTSGTIALCKFNRLMVTSPKALARGYAWLDTLAHEFIHLVISEKSHNNVPIWLHEGLAKYSQSLWRGTAGLALTSGSENLLADAVKTDKLITFEQMHPSMAKLPSQEATALAFAEVFTVVEFLHSGPFHDAKKENPYAATNRVIDALKAGLEMDAALVAATGLNLKGLQRKWKRYLKKRKFNLRPGQEAKTLRFVKNARGKTADSDEQEAEQALYEVAGHKARRFVRLGNLMRERGRLKAASLEYNKARQRFAGVSASLNNRTASTLILLKDEPAAIAILDETVRVEPDDPQTRVLLGRAHLRSKDYDAAKTHYLRARYENPFHPEIAAGLYAIGKATGDQALMDAAERDIRLLSGYAHEVADTLTPAGDDAGVLSVRSSPWGALFVDGVKTSMTTPVNDLRLAPGTYVIRVTDAVSGQSAHTQVTIVSAQPTRVELTLSEVSEAERKNIYATEAASKRAKVPDGKAPGGNTVGGEPQPEAATRPE